jgi:predicted dehydrogenase
MVSDGPPLGVAIVGYGYWGANIGRNLALSDSTEFVGVVDPDPGVRTRTRRPHPSITVWSTLRDALEDSRLQAVIVATPAASHSELALQALRAGRHVLVEKPLALKPTDARDICDVARHLGLIAMVGHTFLYSPPVATLKRYIDEGRLGRVNYLASQRLSLGKIRPDCNALWNLAPHDVSILMHLLDEAPSEVSARSATFLQAGIPDVYFATLEFPSGTIAHIHVSWMDPRKVRSLTVVGDGAMAVYDDVQADQKLAIYDAGVSPEAVEQFAEYGSMAEFQWRTRVGDIFIPKVAMREPLLNEIEAFADACTTGDPPLANAEHGLRVVEVLTAIDASTQHRGCPVAVGSVD